MLELLIGGDLVPTQRNYGLFSKANIDELIGNDLLSLWRKADHRIFNLETPITDSANPIDKCGPHLMAPESSIFGIKALNPSLISLANNHILDQGTKGLKDTIKALERFNIPTVGTGANLSESGKPYVIMEDGFKLEYTHVQR